jgi:small subunit ribosomal protein S18
MARTDDRRPRKPKRNPLHAGEVGTADWKDTALLRTFISDRGKIRSRRVTGLPSESRFIRSRLSTKAMKSVDRDGVEAVVARMRAAGERI